MKCNEINIRDPFILLDGGVYYMYGSRAENFAMQSGGFDVYTSRDLVNWSEPVCCFDSVLYGLDRGANWAPEVHKYGGFYYMFATFTQENDLRGTYILKSDSPKGPFSPHSNGAVTPKEWECLDGTLYVNEMGKPFLVFCREHTKILDGTICFAPLSSDLSEMTGEPITIFAASSCPWVNPIGKKANHYVTDGPFLYKKKNGDLFMIWSSFVNNKYAELLVKFENGQLGTSFKHLPPIIDSDGGHGMIFEGEGNLYLTYHSPNESGLEKPIFVEISCENGIICVK